MRTYAAMGCLIFLTSLIASAPAAPPKNKAKNKPAAPLPKVDADVLPAGTFGGVLTSPPSSDRMVTLKITYPEVRLKPGAKMPNLRSSHGRAMQQIYQQMHRAEQMPHMRRGSGGRYNHHHHYNALSSMMQQQRMYMQGQQRMAQAMARAQQQELRLLQQEIKAIQNMYQVVQVSRDFDFQLTQNVKVRMKDLPEQFDEKGNIKKYTREELTALKGKDKNLMGYESSLEALHPGQTVLVALRTHKKAKLATPAAQKDKDAAIEIDPALEHKMQVTVLVILKDGDMAQTSKPRGKKNKK